MTAYMIVICRRPIWRRPPAGNATMHTYRHVLWTLIELLESKGTATSQPKRIEYSVAERIVFSGHNLHIDFRCLVTGESGKGTNCHGKFPVVRDFHLRT